MCERVPYGVKRSIVDFALKAINARLPFQGLQVVEGCAGLLEDVRAVNLRLSMARE